MKYMFFVNYINILILLDKFVTVSINLLHFNHGICYFLKYSLSNPCLGHASASIRISLFRKYDALNYSGTHASHPGFYS